MRNEFFKAIDILHLAKQSGIKIILNNDQLKLTFAQNKSIDKGLLENIKGNKQVIIDYLANKNFKFNKVDKNQQQISVLDRKSTRHIPLSFSQERLWFIDQLEGSVQYHLPTVLRLKGKLNIAALKFAIHNLVIRHEVLRTVIREKDGEGFQYIKDNEEWDLKIVDGAAFGKDEAALQNAI
jgi:hypothetical protein